MKLLIDTNILIPLEPLSRSDIEPHSRLAMDLYRLSNKYSHQLYVHPLISTEIAGDKNPERAELRRELLQKYQLLPKPPGLENKPHFTSAKGTHDWVDEHLLAAIEDNAVDYLVSNDRDIHAKAKRENIEGRVLTLKQAVDLLQQSEEILPPTPPKITSLLAHELDESDAIFEGFESDYPDFASWIKKCKREHRKCFVIEDSNSNEYAGISILKPENATDDSRLGQKVLKICLFKIAREHTGYRYGELLLKSIFDYCRENRITGVYLTSFPKQTELIHLVTEFGFDLIGNNGGEEIYGKRFTYSLEEKRSLTPFEFHKKFGPWVTKFEGNSTFVIPIQPRYYSRLFPEDVGQLQFVSIIEPHGNSITKAYLSKSGISGISRGDNLLFYISQDMRAVKAIGIVEDVVISADVTQISEFVRKITVYSYEDLLMMTGNGQEKVLAIKLRRVAFVDPPITFDELYKNDILNGPPQTIQRIQGGLDWLIRRMEM